jgi:hypothetical protein
MTDYWTRMVEWLRAMPRARPDVEVDAPDRLDGGYCERCGWVYPGHRCIEASATQFVTLDLRSSVLVPTITVDRSS